MRLYLFPIALIFILMSSSCQPERGCMDPTADNYNVNAEKDDGTCVLAREKLIGEYTYTRVYIDVRDTTETEVYDFGTCRVSQANTDYNDLVLNLNGQVVMHGTVDADEYTLEDLIINEDIPFSHTYEEFEPDLFVDTLLLFPRQYTGQGYWLLNDTVDSWLVLTNPWYEIDTGHPPVVVTIPQEFNYYLTKIGD
ncbi:MAG: hypothetical protein ACI85F_002123 [Bacteroidia bacterium]|jgi:hypothetical protein